MKNISIPLNPSELLDYINIGRGDKEEPLYTEDDIKRGTPNEEKLCWAITSSGVIVPNAGYYKDKRQWGYAYVLNSRVLETTLYEKVIAYVMYK